MPKTRPPYPPEFRQRIIELHLSGRSAKSLAAEFGCTEQSVRNWSRQAGSAPPAPKEKLRGEDPNAYLLRAALAAIENPGTITLPKSHD